MTVSDQRARPPDNPPRGEEWMPYPGAGFYDFSHRGKARSRPRTINGKPYEGKEPLSTRLNNQGYVLVDIRMDDGTKKTVTMHTGVLRSHAGEPGPGQETLHGPGGPQDNRWPENIRWGTRPENLADMAANRPPREPKAPKTCPRCESEHADPGRRCHKCVVELGQRAAPLIEETLDPERAARELDYPSPAGLFKLAVKYGGLRVYVDRAPITAGEAVIRHAASPPSWLRRVINRAGASGRNSDAQ